MSTILIVEDEQNILEVLKRALTAKGYRIRTAMELQRAKELLDAQVFDLILSDLRLPDGSGMDLLQLVGDHYPDIPVMIMTAYGSIENAVEAVKLGAADYAVKPFKLEDIEFKVQRILEKQLLKASQNYLMEENHARFGQIIGQSQAMQSVYNLINQVALSDTTVLITGESGTGKEMVARTLHQRSNRADKPFIVAHCAAYSQNLIESELFGHEKGAFTGATGQRKGRLEASDGGTLFLDELGEIPLEIQVKLLRFLESKTFERVGGNDPIQVDVRIISATHRDLESLIEQGRFRDDLYWRMNVFPIKLPPLRERADDIMVLARHFMQTKAPDRALTINKFSERLLKEYTWPGNVRELENIIERALLLSTDSSLRIDAALSKPGTPLHTGEKNINQILEDVEKKLIQDALGQTGGNQAQAAKLLGIQRSTLQYKLQKYKLVD